MPTVAANPSHPGYVDVRHGKMLYLMRPVLSSTGAVRLEDMKARTLVVQIAAQSMLMDVKAGRRLVDECISPRQRSLMEAARARALEVGASPGVQAASGAASAPEPTAPASAPAR